MSEHVEWQELHELLKELAQKEYGDKYGEQIFWYFQDVIDDSCKLDVLEEENKRLNNIINELEKYCIEEIEDYSKEIKSQYITDNTRVQYEGEKVCFEDILGRLQELKGDGSNE